MLHKMHLSMKHFVGLCIILLAPLMSFGQGDDPLFRTTSAVQKDQFILDPYYGYPNGWTMFARILQVDGIDLVVSGFGPIGVRIEYLVADKIGLSGDIWYVSSGIAFVRHTQVLIDSINMVWEGRIYSYKRGRNKVAAIFCFNFHFVKNPNFDLFVSVGAGTKDAKFFAETNDPDPPPGYQEEAWEELIPVDARASLNGRYFFNSTFGFNFAIGLGGPLMSGGISSAI
jgi:hypothetical protein